MKTRIHPLRPLLAMCAALTLTACSRTVEWEEEVPLNTGETIWVKRTDSFKRGSELGNPLQSAWWPNTRTYEFSWQGRVYLYETKPKVLYGPILIFSDASDKSIAVVDSTSGWNCTKAGYGEFRWVDGGWQLQQNVSKSLVGQPRNLMVYFSADDGEIPIRVDREFRQRVDTNSKSSRKDMQINEKNIAIDCTRSK